MADSTQQEDPTLRVDELRKQTQAAEADSSNFSLISLIESFFNWLKDLLDGDDDKGAPDFEDADNAQDRAKAEKEYAGREAAERKQYGDFKEEAAGKWNISNIVSSSRELLAMRAREEAANGGKPIQAGMPFEGEARISSGYGHRDADETHGIGTTEHQGLDIAPMPAGTKLKVVSAMPGIVIGAGWREGYGNCIEVMDIYGVHHRYGHLSEIDVKVGEQVEKAQQLGRMGMTGHATGVHLHYEQRDSENHSRNPQLEGTAHHQGEVLIGANAVIPKAPVQAPAQPAAVADKKPAAPTTPHAQAVAAAAPVQHHGMNLTEATTQAVAYLQTTGHNLAKQFHLIA